MMTVLISENKKPDSAVLIVDKIGVIGEKLAEEFSKDFYVFFVSSRNPNLKNNKVAFINYKGKIPKIPQNRYSKMFLIDDGSSITKNSCTSFIEEAKNLNADFYFLGSVRNFDIKHTDELVKVYDKSKVLVFGDLFDKEFLFDQNCVITKYIQSVNNKKKIIIPNDGLGLSYPITFEDTVKLIIKASYLNISQKIILLFYKDPITDISLAHIFQKIDPEVLIDFEKEDREEKLYIPKGSEYAITKYDLKKNIENLNVGKSKKKIMINKKAKKRQFNLFKPFLLFIVFLLFMLFLPYLTTLSFQGLARNQLESAVSKMEDGDYSGALNKTKNSLAFYNISKKTNDLLNNELRLINLKELILSREEDINTQINTVTSMDNMLEGLLLINNTYLGESIKPKEDFNNGLELLEKSFIETQKSLTINRNQQNNSEGLGDHFLVLEPFLKISEMLPQVLGFDEEYTFLILFQDNNELRPAGGKLEAVGKLVIKDLQVQEFDIMDVKKLDEELKILVEPPFALRRYIPIKQLLLEDSNFNPDFVESAISSSALYNLISEEDVDGVVGVDLYFIKKLLEITGPIYLEDYGKNITSENVLQVSAENVTKSGEKAFIFNLVNKIKTDLEIKNKIPIHSLIGIINDSIIEKHILFAFKDSDTQSVFSSNNLSGSLVDNRPVSENKINDFFGINESNLGLSKINYFISRSLTKKNVISENGKLSSEVVIAYKNSSQVGSSFAKTYKNYLQVILPDGAILNEISLTGKRQEIMPEISNPRIYEDNRFVEPEELEVEQRTQNNKSIFSFLVSVAPDSVETIKIKYTLPFDVSTISSDKSVYSLIIYKQPGIGSFPFNLTFEHGGSYVILPDDSYSLDVKADEMITATILKK
jgi:hypothetical protein